MVDQRVIPRGSGTDRQPVDVLSLAVKRRRRREVAGLGVYPETVE